MILTTITVTLHGAQKLLVVSLVWQWHEGHPAIPACKNPGQTILKRWLPNQKQCYIL